MDAIPNVKSDMTNTKSTRDAFETISAWCEAARSCSKDAPPDLAPLLYTLANGTIQDPPFVATYEGQTVIGFTIRGEGKVGVKIRYLLPIHFAQLRMLELIPGMKIKLSDDSHRERDERNGVPRGEADMIYHFTASHGKPAGVDWMPKDLALVRVFLNAPFFSKLHERRDGDYRYLVPRGYVLVKNRTQRGLGQERALEACQALVMSNRKDALPFTASQVKRVLTSLFSIGDDWHWGELIGRLPDDYRCPPIQT